tara:strand:- start:320 stop:568 length:249 start_codon:yes stop_codon:yes gene_type:complete
MKGAVPPDPETSVSTEHWAVIYMPGRNRQRYPANCVRIVDSIDEALEGANAASRLFPAKVLGPSKSSEGQTIYYLVEWLSLS